MRDARPVARGVCWAIRRRPCCWQPRRAGSPAATMRRKPRFVHWRRRQDAAFLGLRGLLRNAIEHEDWSEATALARQAETVQPGAAWLRRERARLAVRAGNWSEALALADADAPKAALAAAAAEAEPDPWRAMRLAKQAWQDDPSLAPAALAYASRLRAAGRESRALAVIRHSWSIAPHPDLAAFALAPVERRAGSDAGCPAADRCQSRACREPPAAGAHRAGGRTDRRGTPPRRGRLAPPASTSVGCGCCWRRSRRRRAATPRPGALRSAMHYAVPRRPNPIRRGDAMPAIPRTRRGIPTARTASPSAACAGALLRWRRHASCYRTGVPRS